MQVRRYEVAGRTNGMGLDGIGEISDRANGSQTVGLYETGFVAGSLTGIGPKD